MTLEKVAVIMGGKSAEREISLLSGNGVLQALKAKDINAHSFDPKTQPIEQLKHENFTSAFIALHGKYGEDGTIQGVLEYLNIPYTGSGVLASSIALNKQITKLIWQSYGLSTPKFVMLDDNTNFEHLGDELGLPLIIKPVSDGSSLGITKINTLSQIKAAYDYAKSFDHLVMAEQFISGRELTCAVMQLNNQLRALPIIEIKAPNGNYDYQNKYFTDDVQYICPAHLDESITQTIQNLCIKAFNTIGCRGWARVDLILKDDTPYLLEINTSPGMTSHSLVPMAAKAIGIEYAELVTIILQQASLDY